MLNRQAIWGGEIARPGRNELRLAWQVLEILGDQRIPYEGELKRFRAEGDFLVRALTDLVSQCRSQIHKLEHDFEELEKLVGERELPPDILQAVHHMAKRDRIKQRAIARTPH
jgi:hypothetical protein